MFNRVIAPVCVGALLISASLAPGLSRSVSADTSLTAAGSTFDFPFFDAAFRAYGHGLTVNYQPVGSGAGIQQFTQKLVDFGATDVPMNPATELPAAEKAGGAVAQIPVALGGISIAYNVGGLKTGLHLDGGTLARIFLGQIKSWNDKGIKKLNPKVKLPSTAITVVHRSDGSGTSYGFTDYLSKVSDSWRGIVGVGKAPNFPVGVGGKGNLGVAQLIQQTDGAIGYVELAYVLQNHFKQATILNRHKQYETPTLKTVAADAASFPRVDPTGNFSIANGNGKDAYPIATYSWVIVFKHQSDSTKGKAIAGLLKWLVTTAQTKFGKKLDYVPLPANVQKLALSTIKSVK